MKRAWVQYAQKVVGRYSMGHIRTVAPENLTVSETGCNSRQSRSLQRKMG